MGLDINEGGFQWDEAEPSTFENFKDFYKRTGHDALQGR